MTDYNAMSHQQLYAYVWSGSPSAVEGEATLNQSQGKEITDAANGLFSTLTKIQSSWSGAAADEFTQQTNAIINTMKDHAEAAQKIYTVMNHVSSVLHWAQTYMPSPPSEAEEAIADIDNNAVVGTIIGIGTFGTSALASEAAKRDIEAKKATAVHVMTTLALAYATAQNELPEGVHDATITDPPGGTSSKKAKSTSGSSSTSAATNAAAAGMLLPYTAGVASAHASAGSSGGVTSPGSTGDSYTVPSSSTGTGSSVTSSSGATGTGSGSTGVGTVTSGLGGTSTVGMGSATGTSAGSNSGFGGTGTTADLANYGSAGALGGYGSSGPVAADDDSGDAGAGGAGGFGSYGDGGGIGSGTIASGGTGTGEISDEEAGGTGTGLVGSNSNAGTTAAAAAGDSSGTGSSAEGMGGMMGGMGMGHGAGSGGEDRGNRASWLKEDEDYWYSEKMKNAAPPGGLIE